MKKYIKLAVVMIAALVTATACSSSDDEPEVKDQKSATTKVELTLSQDILEVYNVTVQYTDASGETKTEAITTSPWTKSLTVTKFPFTGDFQFASKVKDGFSGTKSSYQLDVSYMFETSVEGGKSNSQGSNSSFAILKDNLDKYNILNSLKYSYELTKKDGVISIK